MTTPSPEQRDIERALRSLHLPLDPSLELTSVAVAEDRLDDSGVPAAERAAAIAADVQEWARAARPPRRLQRLVRAILRRCAGSSGEALANGYFEAHQKLVDAGELSFAEAQELLSNARLVIHLMTYERMSCAQVARVLSAPIHGTEYNWEQVRSIAKSMDMSEPSLSAGHVQEILSRDRDEQVARFADGTADVDLELVADASRSLGLSDDDIALIAQLAEPEFEPAVMILLHFMLTVCEFYDHPLSVMYEFSPRGVAFASLQEANPLYGVEGNAALNIAKGAVALDAGWAWGRKRKVRGAALVLAGLLARMEEMHYPARRELASWLRQWIVRRHLQHQQMPQLLEWVGVQDDAYALISRLAELPTGTYGSVEQRMVDAAGAFLHRTPEWAGRGLRDSVFASNVSRKKLGDCEFVNRQHAAICAYEAHAGALTDAYVRGHEASFRRVLEGRREDLEMRAEPADWNIRVIFVAHQVVGVEALRQVQVGDFIADFEMIDYEELMERLQLQIASRPDGRSEFAVAVNSHLVGPLNESWVPEAIRDRVRERLSAPTVSSVKG